MKYKCIKNYWMNNESAELGHTPAFVDGMVYDFISCDDETFLLTHKDNHKCDHYMDKDELDNSGYFELVEE